MKDLSAFSKRSHNGAGDIEGSIVWIARIEACVTTAVRCLTKQVTQGDQRQMFCENTHREMLELAMQQLIGIVGLFRQHRAGNEVILEEDEQTTHLEQIPSTCERHPRADVENHSGITIPMSYDLCKTAIFAGQICKSRLKR